jgi:Flp pilus assembly protein TadG
MKKKLTHTPKTPAQAMVEFALVLPILLLVIYGVLEVGRLIFIYSSVVTAARSAARYGATTGLNVAGGVPRYQDCAGMRAAAQMSAFINDIPDANIVIQHDKGEGVSQADYCASGTAIDTSFDAKGPDCVGNICRVRVTVSTQYSPILPLVPFSAYTISSTAARTILVSVSLVVTGAPQTWNGNATDTPTATSTATSTGTATGTGTATVTGTVTLTITPITFTPTFTLTPTKTLTPTTTLTPTKTGTPTSTSTATTTPTATATSFVCVVTHSSVKTSPSYAMTIFNDSASLPIHVSQIQVTWNTQANQILNAITLGAVTIWSGTQNGSPSVITTFTGDLSIGPGSSKLVSFGFAKNYNTSGSEQIIVNFLEAGCPTLDSNNASQLK